MLIILGPSAALPARQRRLEPQHPRVEVLVFWAPWYPGHSARLVLERAWACTCGVHLYVWDRWMHVCSVACKGHYCTNSNKTTYNHTPSMHYNSKSTLSRAKCIRYREIISCVGSNINTTRAEDAFCVYTRFNVPNSYAELEILCMMCRIVRYKTELSAI